MSPPMALDPHGIHWLRDVLKSLAGQGRTVFVSSHLLAEMSLMADELVVIGLGKMIDNGPVDDFVKKFTQTTVLVRTPTADTFAEALRREGAEVEALPDGALVVSGADGPAVGELAHREGIVLHELATQSASLEQAFMSATGESEEFVAHDFVASVTAPADEIAPEADQGPDGQRGGAG